MLSGSQAGATILLEDAGAEEVLFVVRGRAVISRRGVEVNIFDGLVYSVYDILKYYIRSLNETHHYII